MKKVILSLVVGVLIGMLIMCLFEGMSGSAPARSAAGRPKDKNWAVSILRGNPLEDPKKEPTLAPEDAQILAVNILSQNPLQEFEQNAAVLHNFITKEIPAGREQRIYAAYALRNLTTFNDKRPMPRRDIIGSAENEMKDAEDRFLAAVCKEYEAVLIDKKNAPQQ